MAKIRMKKPTEAVTLEAAFKEFTIARTASGVADKTLQTYASHFKGIAKHLDMGLTFAELSKRDLDNMVVSQTFRVLLVGNREKAVVKLALLCYNEFGPSCCGH